MSTSGKRNPRISPSSDEHICTDDHHHLVPKQNTALGQLSNELLHHIAGYLASSTTEAFLSQNKRKKKPATKSPPSHFRSAKDLQSLALVYQCLRPIAEEHLFRVLFLYDDGIIHHSYGPPALMSLVLLLICNPHLRGLVKYLYPAESLESPRT